MFRSNQENGRPWVHISVHKKVREFDAKFYLAVKLVEAGFNVTIGKSSKVINATKFLPRGIYCDIRHLITRKQKFKRIKSYGHKIVAFDEEATSVLDWEEYKDNHISEEVTEMCSALFAWGPVHYNAIIQKLGKGAKEKVFDVGHPRFDVLRSPANIVFKDKTDSISKKYRDFILFTSNTGGWIMNKEIESVWRSYVDRNVIKDTPENYDHFYKAYEHRVQRHKELVELIKYLSVEINGIDIIVRPHFTESIEDWENDLGSYIEKVKIIHEFSSIPWILASKLVVHSSCTSGTEAFIAGKNVVTYRPVKNEKFDSEIPNNLSHEVNSKEQIKEIIDKIIGNDNIIYPERDEEKIRLASQYFSSIKGENSTSKVVKILKDISFIDNFEKLRYLHVKVMSILNMFKYCSKNFIKNLLCKSPVGLENHIYDDMVNKNIMGLSLKGKIVVKKLEEELFILKNYNK